jgi:transposase
VILLALRAKIWYRSDMAKSKDLPKKLSTAHEVILVQSSTINRLSDEVKTLKQLREELLAEIRAMKSGKKREKFINADQILLEFGDDKELQASLEAARREAEAEIERITYERKKVAPQRKKAADSFPAHLPREVIEVGIPESFQSRIASGELLIKRYEITEALKTIPTKVIVLQYKKPVLAYANDLDRELPVDGEANLGEKGRYHPSTAALVVQGKFGQHLPLYRLQDLFSASGWTPSRSSLDYLTDLVDEVTQELPRLMLSRMMDARCIGLDDTHVKLIMPKELPKIEQDSNDLRTKRLQEKMREALEQKKDSLDAKMWGYTSFDSAAPYDLFDFRVSRHRDGPDEFLSGYAGHVMADCYSGNMSVILASGSKMTRMACWAHARRHVFEHQDNDLQLSAYPLALMNQLYDIERRATGCNEAARGEIRARDSQAVLNELGKWLAGPLAATVLPSSKLAGALNYVRNHWEALRAYTANGSLPIDNNQCERLMRRVALGRKNWLFVGSMRAGIRNANLMSLVASAHRQDLDVLAYLESIITHLLRGTAKVADLLPDVWKIHHPESVRTYRAEERRYKADTAVLESAKRKCRQQLKQAQ